VADAMIEASVGLGTRASVGWKWKAGAYPPQIGCSICRSSSRAAFAARGCPPPH